MKDQDPARSRLAALAMGGIVFLSLNLFNPALPTLLPGAASLTLLGAFGVFRWRRFSMLAWRMKWVFLSLLVFYGWLGSSPEAEGAAGFLPALDGLHGAALRIAALLLVIGWVVWLTTVFDISSQAGGLHRWIAPLGAIGFRVERFSTRLFLALRYFEDGQGDFRRVVCEDGRTRRGRVGAAREFLVERLSGVLSGPGSGPDGSVAAGPDQETGAGSIRVLGLQVGLLWLAVGCSWFAAVVAAGWRSP